MPVSTFTDALFRPAFKRAGLSLRYAHTLALLFNTLMSVCLCVGVWESDGECESVYLSECVCL